MADSHTQLMSDLQGLDAKISRVDYSRRGYHLEVWIAGDKVRDVARVFLNHEFYLVFITAVHMQSEIELVYQFAHYSSFFRVNCRLRLESGDNTASISEIFQGADWHEREIRDLFGTVFVGHPNLKPLVLLEEDADLKPLLKTEKTIKSREQVSWPEKTPPDTEDNQSGS